MGLGWVSDEHDITRIVRECNASLYTSLPRRQTGTGMTDMMPNIAYNVLPRWDPSLPATSALDGASQALPGDD
jgi:hypothetical protein